jgi:hypothetical protein
MDRYDLSYICVHFVQRTHMKTNEIAVAICVRARACAHACMYAPARAPLHRRLHQSQGWCECGGKYKNLPRNQTPVIQPVASHYSD